MIIAAHEGAGNAGGFLIFPGLQTQAVGGAAYRAEHQVLRKPFALRYAGDQPFDGLLDQSGIGFFPVSSFGNVLWRGGTIKSDMSYGLYHNNTLVSLISMRKYNNNIEIMRLCDKLYTNVVNGYEALLRYIKSEYHPDKIIACVNRRFDDGKIYEKIGFMLKGCTDPDFFYVDYCRRYDKHSTVNKEAMQKIYDCGHKIYEL